MWTTLKKALQLRAKENAASDGSKETLITPNPGSAAVNNDDIPQASREADKSLENSQVITPELSAIMYEEQYHFTLKRVLYIGCAFACLFLT